MTIGGPLRDMVTCCCDIGISKNPSISQQIYINLLETLGNHEAKIESLDNNVTSNSDDIKDNNVVLSLTNCPMLKIGRHKTWVKRTLT